MPSCKLEDFVKIPDRLTCRQCFDFVLMEHFEISFINKAPPTPSQSYGLLLQADMKFKVSMMICKTQRMI